MRFRVTVHRTIIESATFEVEADSADDAEDMALLSAEDSGDFQYLDTEPDEVELVEPLEELPEGAAVRDPLTIDMFVGAV